LKSRKLEHFRLSKKGKELSLSGSVLVDLLKAVVEKGACFRFKASGFSMSPFIKDGDMVTIYPLSGRLLGLGDVVAFVHQERETLVIHRLVGKKGNNLLVKGDNARQADGVISKTSILGCVRTVERDGKKVLLGLGPERFLIAALSRTSFLFTLLNPLRQLLRPIARLYNALA
jgi:hypothetical protein